MTGFGYKTGWLAIRGCDIDEIIAALCLDDSRATGDVSTVDGR